MFKKRVKKGVDVSIFLLFLCRDCCYDNKKLKISYPVKPVFSAKLVPVNLVFKMACVGRYSDTRVYTL